MPLPTHKDLEQILCAQCQRPVEGSLLTWNPTTDEFTAVVTCHHETEEITLHRSWKASASKLEAGQAFGMKRLQDQRGDHT